MLTHIAIIIPIGVLSGLLRKSLRTENRAHHDKKLIEYTVLVLIEGSDKGIIGIPIKILLLPALELYK